MCLKTQYSYTACGCPADKPARKNICWVQYCQHAKTFTSSRPCENLVEMKPAVVKLLGLCPTCLIAPKHDSKAKGYQFRFETEAFRAYKRNSRGAEECELM